MKSVRTSDPRWLTTVTANYRRRDAFRLIDDARIGIDPSRHSIAAMAQLGGIRIATAGVGLLVAAGMSGFGALLVAAALADPEPTSKLGLSIAAGTALVFTGGMTAIRILTRLTPPDVRIGKNGIDIRWTEDQRDATYPS